MLKLAANLLAVGLLAVSVAAQTEQAYEQDQATASRSLLDPSRFSVHHMLSFGMAGGGSTDLKSQSLYTAMIQYQFAKPVTLNLNFSLPIYSSFSESRNLTWDNIQSFDYFKSMPFDIGLTWKPSESTMLRLSVSRRSAEDYYFGGLSSPYFFNTLSDSWSR